MGIATPTTSTRVEAQSTSIVGAPVTLPRVKARMIESTSKASFDHLNKQGEHRHGEKRRGTKHANP